MEFGEQIMRTFIGLAGAALLLAACQAISAKERSHLDGIRDAVSG